MPLEQKTYYMFVEMMAQFEISKSLTPEVATDIMEDCLKDVVEFK